MKIISKKEKQAVVRAIKNGEVVALPTDTVYGLVGIAADPSVQDAIYRMKQRPEEKRLPVFVGSLEMAKAVAHIDERQERFLRQVWPGQVTVVVKNKQVLPGFGDPTIALRMPADMFVLDLIKEAGVPLTGTSANISGEPALTNAGEVLDAFSDAENAPSLVVTQSSPGAKIRALSSTVVDITDAEPAALREGPISFERIKSVWRHAG